MGKELSPVLVTRLQLADLLGVNPRTASRLLEEGLPVAKAGKGGAASLFDVKECFAWFLNRERAQLAGNEEGMSPQKARALLDQKRREELDLRLQVRRGELVPAADVHREFADAANQVKARLRRIPDATAERLIAAAAQGPLAVKALLLTEIDAALRELAERATTVHEDEVLEATA